MQRHSNSFTSWVGSFVCIALPAIFQYRSQSEFPPHKQFDKIWKARWGLESLCSSVTLIHWWPCHSGWILIQSREMLPSWLKQQVALTKEDLVWCPCTQVIFRAEVRVHHVVRGVCTMLLEVCAQGGWVLEVLCLTKPTEHVQNTAFQKLLTGPNVGGFLWRREKIIPKRKILFSLPWEMSSACLRS